MEQTHNPLQKPDHPPAQAILHEVRTAENSAAFLLPTLHSLKTTTPHLKLLDVGAGSGTISTSFAKLIPDGHVTGLDINASILPRARAVAERAGVENIDFRVGSVYELPFADESFDVVFCHQVLVHIGRPWDALREMRRVTKKGGIVAVREGDYDTECVWPELDGLRKFHGLMAGLMGAGGGTSTAGRQLLAWVLRAGVEREKVELSFSTSSYHTFEGRKLCSQGLCDQLRRGDLRERALKFDLGSENDFEEMAEAWEDWAKRENASLAMLHGEVLVRK